MNNATVVYCVLKSFASNRGVDCRLVSFLVLVVQHQQLVLECLSILLLELLVISDEGAVLIEVTNVVVLAVIT